MINFFNIALLLANISQFFGWRGVFKTLSNIYDGLFTNTVVTGCYLSNKAPS